MASNFMREIKDFPELEKQLKDNAFLQILDSALLQTGRALLTFRKNAATIYYKGRQLCTMQHKLKNEPMYAPTIYNHYLPIIRTETLNKNKAKTNYSETQYLSENKGNHTFVSVLPEILDNLEKEVDDEAYQVSAFYRFSPLIKQYNTTVVLLDIEAAFAETGEKTDRIDMVLYHTVKRQLIFVEVKRLSDKRLYVQPGSGEPEIIEQMKRYKKRITDEKDKIKAQYDRVIENYNQLSGKNLQPIGDGEYLLGLLVVECSEVECFERIRASAAFQDLCTSLEANDIKMHTYGQTKNATPGTLLSIYNTFK